MKTLHKEQVQNMLSNKLEKAYIYDLLSTIDSNLRYQVLDLNNFSLDKQFYSLDEIIKHYRLQ